MTIETKAELVHVGSSRRIVRLCDTLLLTSGVHLSFG